MKIFCYLFREKCPMSVPAALVILIVFALLDAVNADSLNDVINVTANVESPFLRKK